MLVGEIGIDRKEYLYDLMYWEIILIVRGYFARKHSGWEQARLIAYNAHFCMGSKDIPPTVDQWLPFPWEHDTPPISEEEEEELLNEIESLNRI